MTSNPNSNLLNDSCVDVRPKAPAQAQPLPPGALELALPTSKLWECGRLLDFHFLSGTEQQKQSFRQAAAQWSQHANLLMRFDQPLQNAEFRVAFDKGGNWSYTGLENLSIPSPQATMNIQNLSSILHEVGHALGCIHEHSSPASAIQWNKPVVYQALAGPPNNWNKEKVDTNFFERYAANQTQFSAFDSASVMLYFFPASWTLNGIGTNANTTLSSADKAFINRCYPGCSVDFSKPTIANGACTVNFGPRVLFNQSFGNSWLMNQPNTSFIEVAFTQPKQYASKDIYRKAILKLVHLTQASGSRAGSSPIDIVVNNQVIKKDYSPPSSNFITEQWDITSLMKDGANQIRLNFKNAKTNYWIQKLQVDCDRILS